MKIETKDGRTFLMVGEEPYLRKDGTLTNIRWWRSQCVRCGVAFDVATPVGVTSLEHSGSFGRIHCDPHKLTLTEVAQRWSESMKKKREAA